jgi:predicted PurR-regulated permease PerM
MNDSDQRERYRIALRILTGALIIGFMVSLWIIAKPFWTPLLWAIVLTTTTWPTYTRLRDIVPKPAYLAPLLGTLLLGFILVLIVVSLPVQLTSEVKVLAARIRATDPQQLSDSLASVPFVGELLGAAVLTFLRDSGSIAAFIEEHQGAIFSFATSAARGLLSTTVGIFASLVGCFILYRHGELLVAQLRNILERIGGEGIANLIDTVHITVRGAAYSVLATAIAQGALAGFGYYVAGAPTPLLLGVLTLIVSFVPFGPPFVYVPVTAYLLFGTDLPWYHGVGLAIWGTVVVSTVDNILRPLFISHTTKLSTILVFIGVLGGAASFGLLGVFIGPALIAIAQLFWLELARPSSPSA